MRLADFILENVDPILAEWESFARGIWPKGATADPAELRDEAVDILRATAADMRSDQTAAQQADKSRGVIRRNDAGDGLTRASSSHGTGRAVSGFDLAAVVAEYRALRASVLRLWRASEPSPDVCDLEDVTRFNESMDQSLTDAVHSFAEHVDRDRDALLASEQESRRQAEAANRAKDLFLATLSHEMRTPLNAIAGWVSILLHQDAGAKRVQEGLKVIERNTRAQVQLIDDLLDVSRIISGKLRMNLQPCELAEVINAAVNAMRTAADSRGITLKVRVDSSAGNAVCDGVRIQQVVWNLVSNAVKFTPKGGRVDVMLSRARSSYQIQVTDTGQGITPDLLPYVFDRFRQADSSMRRQSSGLGLGLSIAKYIVEAHGGNIEAASPGEGKGSTFTVLLPIAAVRIRDESADEETTGNPGEDESTDADHIAVRPPVRLDGLQVLVVDDEADARRVLALVLERVGAVVATADSARAAIEALPSARPDVLVSDLGMPDEDGLDLIRQLRDGGHSATDLPAVALTAFVQKDDANLALSAGFQVHLAKPVDPHELTSVIARLARRSD
jgi:signal transduction histidine kinase/ActR/RegA family two-component response regulator